MFQRASRYAAVFAALLCISFAAFAGPDGPDLSPVDAAFKAASLVEQPGPVDVSLRDQATLRLPDGYVFVPRPAADQIMQAFGNRVDERFLGLVLPTSGEDWFVVAEFENSGYIQEDDARDWNVDELFENLKQGTEAANEERRRRDFEEIEVVGWVEPPRYDPAAHRLVWSMSARPKGAPADAPQSVNYNTYALGREGYITLNLIADLQQIDRFKPHAETLLAALDYASGKTYADFDAATDRMAEYGLAALVGGVAAKKLGLFAVIAAFVAKFAKVILLAVIALGGGLFKYLRRDKHTAPGRGSAIDGE